MKIHRPRFLVLTACVLLLGMLAGCQGGNSPTAHPLETGPPAADRDPAPLPSFPGDSAPAGEVLRQLSQNDNPQPGNDTWRRSATGASTVGDALQLTSAAGTIAWGMWRWGTFGTGILPLELALDVDSGSGEFWLLLSDYDAGYWELHGPLDGSIASFDYHAGTDYLSAGSYTYVALAVADGNSLTVNGLNLIAASDVDPPAAPQGLTALDVRSTIITLGWTLNGEPDMYRYNVYSGPTPDFLPGGAGVVFRGQVGKLEAEYTVTFLAPGQTYHFRITALDTAQNESPPSDCVTETTLADDVPEPPTNVTAGDKSGSWADLSWTPTTSPGLLGYEVYTGPTEDFELDDPDVVKRNETLLPPASTSWRMTGLSSNTEYYCRMLSYCINGRSPLSDTATFTTTDSVPPVPGFTYLPTFPEKDKPVSFDPSPTGDVDTPLSELVFMWDYDDDDDVDETTTGPEKVEHTYTARGPVTCRLTVTDGTAVSTRVELIIGHRYKYAYLGHPRGPNTMVKAVATDPDTSRIAVLAKTGPEEELVRRFNGTSWQTIGTAGLPTPLLLDVELSATGVSLLAAEASAGEVTWVVYNHAGSEWTQIAEAQATADLVAVGSLSIAANDRLGVALITGTPQGESINYSLRVWHQQADTSFRSGAAGVGLDSYPPCDIQRDNANSYALYAYNGQVKVWTFTDSSDGSSDLQAFGGSATDLSSGRDPADHSRVFWAVSTDASRIYYGDNYGTANGGSQFYSADADVTGMLGTALAGDNEGLFCWSDEDSSAIQHIYQYDTTAAGGAGERYEILAGPGAANDGYGSYFELGVSSGIYTVVNEQRDGDLTGHFVVGGSAQTTETLVSPSALDDAGPSFATLAFSNGNLLCLAQQVFPTAISGFATSVDANFSSLDIGEDTWCIPDTGCLTAVSGEYFIGSFTPKGVLLLNRFALGNPEGTLEEALTDVAQEMAQLRHTSAGGTRLCYATVDQLALEVRSWNGTDWSAASEIYSGSEMIRAFTLAGSAGGEWGVAFLDAADELRLIETSSGVWGTAATVSSEPVREQGGIGLAYSAGDDLCLAVERDGAEPGIFAGLRPAGDTLSWELASETNGSRTRGGCVFAFYHSASPLILYYYTLFPPENSRLRTVEKFGGEWQTNTLPFELHGEPIGVAQDSSGNIILCGYYMTSVDRPRAAVLYE